MLRCALFWALRCAAGLEHLGGDGAFASVVEHGLARPRSGLGRPSGDDALPAEIAA